MLFLNEMLLALSHFNLDLLHSAQDISPQARFSSISSSDVIFLEFPREEHVFLGSAGMRMRLQQVFESQGNSRARVGSVADLLSDLTPSTKITCQNVAKATCALLSIHTDSDIHWPLGELGHSIETRRHMKVTNNKVPAFL